MSELDRDKMIVNLDGLEKDEIDDEMVTLNQEIEALGAITAQLSSLTSGARARVLLYLLISLSPGTISASRTIESLIEEAKEQ